MAEKIYLSFPGVVCAAGSNAEELWTSCVKGNQSGLVKVQTAGGKEFFAGRIKDSVLKETGDKYDMRILQIEENALNQISSSVEKVKAKYGAERIAVCIGSCDNGSQLSVAAHRKLFAEGKLPENYSLEIQGADYPATFAKEKFGLKGPACVFSTACASSGSALVKARELIASGICDAVVAGGVDIAGDTVLLGFDSLESVSAEKTNPFSKNRSGITLGEAGAFFVVSKDRTDVQLDDGFCAELFGTGESSDASHMTAPLSDGTSALRAMNEALKDAGLEPEKIDYVNLHGTGTRLNDAMESRAVNLCFGEYSKRLPVSSTKALTGHTLGAAAAVELAVCYMTLYKNNKASGEQIVLPVHVFDGVMDEELPSVNLVRKDENGRVSALHNERISVCMSNSFAFGGCNVSLIIGNANG